MLLRTLVILTVLGVFVTGCATAVNEETRAADNQRIAARVLEIGTANCQNKDTISGWKQIRLDEYYDFQSYKGRYWNKYRGGGVSGYGEVASSHAKYRIDPQEGMLVYPLERGCSIRLDEVDPTSFGNALAKQAILSGFKPLEEDIIVLSICAPAAYRGKKYCENDIFFDHRSNDLSKGIGLRAIGIEGGPLDKSIEITFRY